MKVLPRIASARAEGILSALALACLASSCFGQGTLRFTFEGQPTGTRTLMFEYLESGMRFGGPYGLANLWLTGSGLSGYPDNGTSYLGVPAESQLRFSFSTFPSTYFNLFSFDAAEGETTLPGPVTLQVVGYKGMGMTVTNTFVTDGINDGTGPLSDFQTFTLDSGFQNLSRVDIISSRFSIDNILIGIPEPSAFALTLLGTLCGMGWRWVSAKRSSGR